MSENATGYRSIREDRYDNSSCGKRQRRRYHSNYRGRRGTSHNYRRDYNKFPKFKDNNYSEERQNSEIMTNSYESKTSEQNSSGHGRSGYSEWSTASLKEKERTRVSTTRRRQGKGQFRSEKGGESGHNQECDNWEEMEGRERKPQNIENSNVFKNTRKRFCSSSTDSDVEKLKTQVHILLNTTNKKNCKSESTALQPSNKDDNQKNTSSSNSSSDSSSEEEKSVNPKQLKKENISEDDVICLGAVEQVENLIEKTSDNGISESCILCEKEGHTSFYCFMVCKNCGGKYHSLKNCLKPANISTVLQRFMEFNLRQCRQYNPEETFDFNSQIRVDSDGIQEVFKRYFDSTTRGRTSPVHSKSSRRRRLSSTESQCSSSRDTSKKRKRCKSKTDLNNPINQFPYNYGFTPFSFGTSGMPFSAQGVNMNSMLALAQMMSQFPFNSTNRL